MITRVKLSDLKLSIQLLSTLFAALVFGSFLPESLQATFYAISISLKEILLFVLPIIIFSCVFSCLLALRGGRAIGLMGGLFAIVCLSNYCSTLVAYAVGSLGLINTEGLTTVKESMNHINDLTPLWSYELPKWVSNHQALYLGFALGSLFSFFPRASAYRFSHHAKRLVTLFLEKAFVPILPLFALGFVLKMQHDGILGHIIQSYFPLIVIILITYAAYLALLFAIAAEFNLPKWLAYLKNVVPVGLVAFSTMSSMATLPVTLEAAKKNTDEEDVARIVIPATVNIHMIGVGIAIPLMAFSILASFGYEFISFTTYCSFALYFILAQFSVAAVPGGAILAMLPVLETHLGFSGEMSALITTLYILFDPFVTVANVLGNSALAIMISKALGYKRQVSQNQNEKQEE